MHNWLSGYAVLSGWGFFWITIGTTQLTIMGVTIYLHRTVAHRALDLSPMVAHIFRFWLWVTTGIVEREWAGAHRKHHAKVETVDDPHSPIQKGLWQVLLFGVWYYKKEAINPKTLEDYGKGCKDDWIERNLYSRHPMIGLMLLLGTYFLLFGWKGLILWGINVLWIPIHAAGIINGVGHWARGSIRGIKVLYQNWVDGDLVPIKHGGRAEERFNNIRGSANILPWGLWIGGEELHANHHAFPTSPKFSRHWYEVDIGWAIICLLRLVGLAKLKSNFR